MRGVVPTIRRARVEDAAGISSCVTAAYARYMTRIGKPPAPMLEDYLEVIRRHDVTVLTTGENIIGVLVLIKQERTLLLDNVAVHPDYQGQGFGKTLIAVAEERARNVGCDTMRLYTNEHMTENIEFYKKLGFEETERRAEQGYRRVYMRKPVRSDGSATASEAREALLFDLDGTLCDPREGIVRCLQYALEQLQHSIPTEDQLARYIGPPLYDSFRALLSSSDVELIERAVGLYRKRFVSKGMFENRVYAGITYALAALQTEGYRLYVVTSKPTVFARRIIDYFGLQPFFQNIYGSELDGTMAGKDELIAHVLAREEIPANNAVMIGDREHDIKGALANGVRPVGVLWGYGSREELNRAGASVLCETPKFLAKYFSPGPSATKKHS